MIKSSMKKSSSTGSLNKYKSDIQTNAYIDNIITPYIQEYQIEAITHIPAYHAGQCAMNFPEKNNIDYAICMATPYDVPEEGTINIIQNNFNQERFEELFIRFRNLRKKNNKE